MSVHRFGVVGAGIVGLAVARRIGEQFPGAEVTVMDKEDRVAAHQTGHNSGVVHAGLYYTPGSLKATLCRRGVALLKDYCTDRGLPYDECGKLVVAVDDSEVPALERIAERAATNGVAGLLRLGPEGLRDIEPHAAGVAALYSPATAITDYAAVARAYADDIVAAGGRIELSFPVEAIRQHAGRVEVRSGERALDFDRLVVCAGLQSDRVAAYAGDSDEPAIVPFRGEYYSLVPGREFLVQGPHLSGSQPRLPVSRRAFHQEGRRLGGRRAKRRAGSRPRGLHARHHLAARRPGRYCLAGIPSAGPSALAHGASRRCAGSLSTRRYLRFARKYVPEVTVADVVRAPSGVRAQAVDRDGSLVDDFRISHLDHVLAVRNAPSPAATSSLAIAEHITDRLRDTVGTT